MKCNDYLDYLSSYIDNELSEEDTAILLEHLAICEECQHTLEELKFIKHEMVSIENIQLPKGFHEEMMGKIIKEEKENPKIISRGYSKKKWMYYLSGLAAAFLFVWLGSNRGLEKNILQIEKANNMATQTKESADMKRQLPEVADRASKEADMLQHRAQPSAFSAPVGESLEQKNVDEEETVWKIKVVSKEETYEKILKIIEENHYQIIENSENEIITLVNVVEDKVILQETLENTLNLSTEIDKNNESLKIRMVLID